MKTTIYLVRHAQPLKNIINMNNTDSIQLQNEKIILSKKGEKQSEKLSKNVFLNNIDAVYSSQYVRAISTAKYIAENNNLDIIIDERLGERVIGTEEKPKDFWIEQMLDLDSKTTDGESQREVRNRMLSFMDDILKNDRGKNVVVVSHATAMTFLLMKWCKLENVVLEGKKRKLVFNGKVVIDDSFNTPEVFELIFNNTNIESIKRINIED